MLEMKIGSVESRFADIIWENEPMTTKQLIDICAKELRWQRTTTYTVLKRLCAKGIFTTQNSVITSQLSRDEFYSIQSQRFVEQAFKGSLPAFLAAFASVKKLSDQEVAEIRRQIDSMKE